MRCFSSFLSPELSACLSRPTLPLGRVFCSSASASELTFRLGPFDTNSYQIVLSRSCHVRTSTEHTQGLIRGIHGSWWVMFFLGPTGTQSSVSASEPEEWVCVHGRKKEIMWTCVFALVLLCV